jgi:hypothetical protein
MKIFSGLLRRVAWYKLTSVPEMFNVSIIRAMSPNPKRLFLPDCTVRHPRRQPSYGRYHARYMHFASYL